MQVLELEKKINKVLVVAAHPDDEILGCGGTISKWSSQEKTIHTLIMAEGITGRDPHKDFKNNSSNLENLKKAAHKANQIVGVHSLEMLGLPDNRMDSMDFIEVVKLIEDKIKKFQPDTILTHHPSDLNIDHRITQQALITACRPQPGSTVKNILFFEVPSSTDWQISSTMFRPQVFINIASNLKSKLEALSAYETEMRPWPHSRSIENLEYLAKTRGASVGYAAAEAFEVGRILL